MLLEGCLGPPDPVALKSRHPWAVQRMCFDATWASVEFRLLPSSVSFSFLLKEMESWLASVLKVMMNIKHLALWACPILNIQKIKSDNIQQLQCSVCDLHCEIILKGHILEKYIICPILQALKLYCCGITIFNYIKPIICVSHLIVIHPFCSSREFREKLIKVAWLEKVTEKSLDFFIFLPWNLFPVCAKGIIFIVCLIFSLI